MALMLVVRMGLQMDALTAVMMAAELVAQWVES
jgi:hypothetical protein